MGVCQPHGHVSRKYLRTSKHQRFAPGKPRALIFFALVCICSRLKKALKMECQPQIFDAEMQPQKLHVNCDTFGGLIYDCAHVLVGLSLYLLNEVIFRFPRVQAVTQHNKILLFYFLSSTFDFIFRAT